MSYYGMKGASGFGGFGAFDPANPCAGKTGKHFIDCMDAVITGNTNSDDPCGDKVGVDREVCFAQIRAAAGISQQYAGFKPDVNAAIAACSYIDKNPSSPAVQACINANIEKQRQAFVTKKKQQQQAKAFKGAGPKLDLPAVFQGLRGDKYTSSYRITHSDAIPIGKKGILWITKSLESKLPVYVNGRLFGSFSGFGADFAVGVGTRIGGGASSSAGAKSQKPLAIPSVPAKTAKVGLVLGGKTTPSAQTKPAKQIGAAYVNLPVAFLTNKSDSPVEYSKTHDNVLVTNKYALWVSRDISRLPFIWQGQPAKRIMAATAELPKGRIFGKATTTSSAPPEGAVEQPPSTSITDSGCPDGAVMTTQGCFDVSEADVQVKTGEIGPPSAPPDQPPPSIFSPLDWFSQRSMTEKVAIAGIGAALLFVALKK